ncbi:MAG: ATP-binding protein [Calditrichaeota bacterium]|nr:ATP-binding protein [Calditrichota bacterium]
MAFLKNGEYTVTFPSHIKYLETIERITSQIASELHFEETIRDDLSIVVTELFNNALHHGNKGDQSKKIKITFRVREKCLQVSVRDEGAGFDPKKIKNPLSPENIYEVGGRGLFLVEQLVDEMRYNITDKGSEIIILKKLPKFKSGVCH